MDSAHSSQCFELIGLGGGENVPIQQHHSTSAHTRRPPPGLNPPSSSATESTQPCRPAGRPLPRVPSNDADMTMGSGSGPGAGVPGAIPSSHAGMGISGTLSYAERARTAYWGEDRFTNPIITKADGGYQKPGVAYELPQEPDAGYVADDDEDYNFVQGRFGPPRHNRLLHRTQTRVFRTTSRSGCDANRPRPVTDTLDRHLDADFRTGVHETESLLDGLDTVDAQEHESHQVQPGHGGPSDSLHGRRPSMVQNIKTTIKRSFAIRRPSESTGPPTDLQSSESVENRSSSSTLHFTTPSHSPAPTVYVDTAHPPAYWTGRFMSTSDRIYHYILFGLPDIPQVTHDNMEFLIAEDLELTTENREEVFRGLEAEDRLLSITMFPPECDAVQIDGKRYVLLTDEEKTRRIFKYLAGVCVNDTALNSLYAYQEMFARKKGNPALLPPGGTMKDSFMSKLFNHGPKRYV